MLLDRILKSLVQVGQLTVLSPGGRKDVYGDLSHDMAQGLRPVTIRLSTKQLRRKIALNPDPAFGEAYMDGTLVFEEGDLWGLFEILGINARLRDGTAVPETGLARMIGKFLKHINQFNNSRISRQNVAHHYDLSRDLYQLFLDEDMQYSCAYFESPNDSLEQAQLQKKQHIAGKLHLQQGHRVLDIGCGWGGMALYLARHYGVEVLGITLSEEQLAVARQRANAMGLSNQVRFELMDYRKLTGEFDRIVSVGMFEHVGAPHFREFFGGVRSLLKPDGVALIHSIGRMSPPGITSPFIHKYIFPGGYIPALSEVLTSVEKSELWATDIEILRVHYARTLKEWRHRFVARWQEAKALYDERFCRMWEFYLAASEMSFRFDSMMVFQMQLSRHVDALPYTRDYMQQPAPDMTDSNSIETAV
ncbi:SAM-dependent methyltransferase [Sneathiella chinensis]|uniref:Cyclopropane-fatty-acyl-phospholipid synthase n=1 Tax=Sneathiella chinensis TaxID=349750 RepID=A0ABQ5U8S9_9PROT|nr:cyclopropane-fatty-acyl-phospholipid synthase family protein [Sneathiella chinensis]GLQ06881.1 cyclopropane-fatty-acyl-phospholipid synthase [Sneathiella chinensis]